MATYIICAINTTCNNSSIETSNYSLINDQNNQKNNTEEYLETNPKILRINFFIVSFGLLGNTLCILILSRKTLIRRKFNWYLLILAVDELIFCLSYFINNFLLIFFSINIFEFSMLVGSLYSLFIAFIDFFSIWITLLSSIDRYYAIKYPLKKRNFLLHKHSKLVTMLVFAMTFMIHCIGTLPEALINEESEFYRFAILFGYVITPILLGLIPVLAIILLNTLLAMNVLNYEKNNRHFKNAVNLIELAKKRVPQHHQHVHNRRKISKRQKSYVFILIALALLVLAVNIPFYIVDGLSFLIFKKLSDYSVVVSIIFISSHASNIFIYICFHNAFRIYLFNIILKPCIDKFKTQRFTPISSEME